jgi:formylglycine-generating enzyme required for sulfatase activity
MDTWTCPTDGKRMVWIMPGSFEMGSPESERDRNRDELRHTVTIERGFWIDVNPVTNAEWTRFAKVYPEWLPRSHRPAGSKALDQDFLSLWVDGTHRENEGEFPVQRVTWYAAQAYCSAHGKRLPTEAEWEYACRAGSISAFWWGDNHPKWSSVTASESEAFFRVTEPGPVGRWPNPWGLCDMVDNVHEWTLSVYAPYPYVAHDGRESDSSTQDRAIRGGRSYGFLSHLRCANRVRQSPYHALDDVGPGFRGVWTQSEISR